MLEVGAQLRVPVKQPRGRREDFNHDVRGALDAAVLEDLLPSRLDVDDVWLEADYARKRNAERGETNKAAVVVDEQTKRGEELTQHLLMG